MAALPRRHRFERPELKSIAPGVGRFTGGWTTGAGSQPWAPQSRFNHGRAAGRIADNSVVSVALTWIGKQIGRGRLQVGACDEADGSYDAIAGHALVALWRRPNPVWTTRASLKGVSDSLLIDGNAYMLKGRKGNGFGRVAELYWIPNHQIEIEREARSDAVSPIRWYWYWRNDGRRERWLPRDVVHFRDGIDPEDPAKGLAALKRQIRNIAGLNAGESYTAGVLRRGHAGTVLAPTEPLSPGVGTDLSPDELQLKAEGDRLEAAMTGDWAGGFHVAGMPLQALPIGMGPEAMGIDRILDRPEAMVLAQLGLNSLVTGLPSSHDTRTYANLAEARRDAYENAINPLEDLIAETLEHQLLYAADDDGEPVAEFGDPDGLQVWWDRASVSALREDANERATRSTTLFTSGLLPRNRALAEGDFDPVDDGDDLYFGEATPAAIEMAEKVAADRRQPPGPGEPADDPPANDDDKDKEPPDAAE